MCTGNQTAPHPARCRYGAGQNCENLIELGFNSIELMSLVVKLEGEFGAEFEVDNLISENLNSVDRLCEFAQQHLVK